MMKRMTTETMQMFKRILMIAVLTTTSVAAFAASDETRTHYVVATKDRTPAYHATVITTGNDARATETYLFEDADGQRIRIAVDRNYKSRLVTAEYSVNDAHPVKVRLELPGNSTSRSEMAQEIRN